jgi:hypothetical protein
VAHGARGFTMSHPGVLSSFTLVDGYQSAAAGPVAVAFREASRAHAALRTMTRRREID